MIVTVFNRYDHLLARLRRTVGSTTIVRHFGIGVIPTVISTHGSGTGRRTFRERTLNITRSTRHIIIMKPILNIFGNVRLGTKVVMRLYDVIVLGAGFGGAGGGAAVVLEVG